MAKKRNKFSVWDIIKKDDVYWVWENKKCRIWTEIMQEVDDFLSIWVEAKDTIHFKGFKDEEVTVKGITFLKEYYGSVEAIPSDRPR